LLEHRVNVNALDSDGQTALHLVSEQGHVNVARLLLEHGADLNAQDNDRCTALHLTSEEKQLEVACLLLEHGTDPDAKDDLHFRSHHREDIMTSQSCFPNE
jgi:ankyrin repeat protein